MITGKETIKQNGTEKQYDVSIDNGDLQLIDSLVSSYGFKDRDSLFKFAISTLLEGNNTEGLFIIKNNIDGDTQKKILSKLTPPSNLLKESK